MVEKAKVPAGTGPTGASSALSEPTSRLQQEKAAAQTAVSDAKDLAKEESDRLTSTARHAAEDQAERLQDKSAGALHQFADALKAASRELEGQNAGPAGEMIAHASDGLEHLSRSLEEKSTGEVIEQVRRFGRENPLGFIAGSVLAGLALGRFAAVSPSKSTSSSPNATPEPSRQAGTNMQGTMR